MFDDAAVFFAVSLAAVESGPCKGSLSTFHRMLWRSEMESLLPEALAPLTPVLFFLWGGVQYGPIEWCSCEFVYIQG